MIFSFFHSRLPSLGCRFWSLIHLELVVLQDSRGSACIPRPSGLCNVGSNWDIYAISLWLVYRNNHSRSCTYSCTGRSHARSLSKPYHIIYIDSLSNLSSLASWSFQLLVWSWASSPSSSRFAYHRIVGSMTISWRTAISSSCLATSGTYNWSHNSLPLGAMAHCSLDLDWCS